MRYPVPMLGFLRRCFAAPTIEITERDEATIRRPNGTDHVTRVRGTWIYRDDADILDGVGVGWRLSKRLDHEHARTFGDLPTATLSPKR